LLFREIDDVVPIICGYCAWAGGDSAKVEENDLAYNLGIDSTLVASTIQFLSVKGFLEPRSREFGLTTKGSRLVDYSLLRIIGKWSFFSELEGGYYRTMQNIFTTSKLSLQRNLAGIRSSYILEFGQLVMNRLSSSIEGYSMDQYPDWRRMVIRM
jgi:hypothetical protein